MKSSPHCDGTLRFSLFCRFMVMSDRQPIISGRSKQSGCGLPTMVLSETRGL